MAGWSVLGVLWNFISNLYAISATVPFLLFFVLWTGGYYYWKDRKKATTLAMDVTTFFLIGTVSHFFWDVFGSSLGFFLIVLLLLIGFGILGNLQYRKKGKIDFKKLARLIWRLAFFLLALLYIILMPISLGITIFAT